MRFENMRKKYLIRVVAVALGGALGLAWYYFVGCRTGICPLTSNPYIMIAYGGVFGLLLVPSGVGNPREKPDSQN